MFRHANASAEALPPSSGNVSLFVCLFVYLFVRSFVCLFVCLIDGQVDPDVFGTWMRILQRVPNGIIWMLRVRIAPRPHLHGDLGSSPQHLHSHWAHPSAASAPGL
jgi:hypothetical protein